MSPLTNHRVRRVAVLAALVASAGLALAGCSSTASPTASSSSGSASSSTLATVKAKLAKVESALSSYPVPSASISNVASLKGKTVYYIPITSQAAQFTVTGNALKAALNPLGISVTVCNGAATPTTIAACVTQATNAKAGAIVTDAIPYVLATNAFDAAEKAGIPVLNTDQLADNDHPASSTLGYIYAPSGPMMESIADWVIVDSNAKANVVINETTDDPASIQFIVDTQKEFSKYCPNCTVTVNKVSSANFSLIPSSTSSTLLKTPNVDYVMAEYDQFLQPTLAGVQQAGKTAAVKGLSGGTALAGLQMMQKKNFLYAGAAEAIAYQGWADADAALRLMTGTSGADLPTYTIPYRIIDRSNIGSLSVTEAAQDSGEWIGPSDFTTSFEKLWGES